MDIRLDIGDQLISKLSRCELKFHDLVLDRRAQDVLEMEKQLYDQRYHVSCNVKKNAPAEWAQASLADKELEKRKRSIVLPALHRFSTRLRPESLAQQGACRNGAPKRRLVSRNDSLSSPWSNTGCSRSSASFIQRCSLPPVKMATLRTRHSMSEELLSMPFEGLAVKRIR